MSSSVVSKKLKTGMRHHQAGNMVAAGKNYADVLGLEPDNADALHLSGLLAHASGDSKLAEALINQAIEAHPTALEFHVNLAAVLLGANRLEEVESVCRFVLESDPGHYGAMSHLGAALRKQRRLGESLQVFANAVEHSRDAATLTNLAAVQMDVGKTQAALQNLIDARELSPKAIQIHINLAAAQRELGDLESAMRSLNTAELLGPHRPEVHVNRGNLLIQQSEPIEAVASFQRAIAFNSSNPRAVAGLGRALEQVGFWEESLEAHRLAAELDPSDHSLQSNYLYSCCLSPLLSYRDVHKAHLNWGSQVEQACDPCSLDHIVGGERPIRIGYVSPDFRGHATMKFLFPLLRAHDRTHFELYLYSQTAQEDATTAKIRQLGDNWRQTRLLSDDQFVNTIQQDAIDILVDLAGHTAENRLAVFARKPAPVQVSFLGYPFTTGLSRVDYYLTDAVRDPETVDSLFVEKLIRLPGSGCCFQPDASPAITASPLAKNGYVTLGSTHRIEKLSSLTLEIWAQVMNRLPEARLLICRDVLHAESMRDQVLERLTTSGVVADRVDFQWEIPEPHLNVYDNIDILLDVFPWGSGTTGFDAMWMGVPLPTIVGERSSGRGAASLVVHSGFPELAADDSSSYVDLVCELAEDLDRLQALRTTLRDAMQATVCDADSFAESVECEYRRMWKRYTDVDEP